MNAEQNQLILYILYLLISIGLTVWVARTLSKNGRVFLLDAFKTEQLADSVNHLLVVGFYLINFGFMTYNLKEYDKPGTYAEIVEMLSMKIGMILIILGTMHFFNLLVFSKMKKKDGFIKVENE